MNAELGVPLANVHSYRTRESFVPDHATDDAYLNRDKLRRLASAYVDCVGNVFNRMSSTQPTNVGPAILAELNASEPIQQLRVAALGANGKGAGVLPQLTSADFYDVRQYEQNFGINQNVLGNKSSHLLQSIVMFAHHFTVTSSAPLTIADMKIALSSMGLMQNTQSIKSGSQFVSAYQYE